MADEIGQVAEADHYLKTWPEFYAAVADGSKPFEVRWDDRGFMPGDVLNLYEWSPDGGSTGRECWRQVTYVLNLGRYFEHMGRPAHGSGFVVLGLTPNIDEARRPRVSDSTQEVSDGR